MAEHLSFFNSKSYAYIWETQRQHSYADENFAREIMQLFTIGFETLNMDGTFARDETGRPGLAYTNEHIVSFARAWTGFTSQSIRGNVEIGHNNRNNIDPMRIEPEWRDKFPKIDWDACVH